MQKHEVSTRHNPFADNEPWEAWFGEPDPIRQIEATGELDGPWYVSADSEDEAIVKLAQSNGWRLWNEENE